MPIKNTVSISLKTFNFLIFNFIENFYHRLVASEIALIKNTNLFSHLDNKQFNYLLKSIRLVKYPANQLIVKEGDTGDELYIIVQGSTRVFTYDLKSQKKIALARLNKGDYFGEQALLGEVNHTRNASVEAISDITLIKISEKFITNLLQINAPLKRQLKKKGYKNLFDNLSNITGIYDHIKDIVDHIQHPNIVKLPAGKVIFSADDKADDVYIILQGEVELIFSERFTHKKISTILHKGHIFGELGVLKNKPRAGTAIAKNDLIMLVIPGKTFIEFVAQKPELEAALSSLQNTYQLPAKGIVEQYFGQVPELGPSLTNIFKMDDGRSITSTKILNQDIFTMSIAGRKADHTYYYKNKTINITLSVLNHQIIGIDAYGLWDNLPVACRILLDKKNITESSLAMFEKSGELQSIDNRIINRNNICECMIVSRERLQALIDKGVNDLDTLSNETGACTVCRCCKFLILEMLGESPWVSSIMKKSIQHNAHNCSYTLTPINTHFDPFLPGQHIVIKAKIEDHWVERTYTISDLQHNNHLRITIKKENHGYFTNWLFDHAPDEFPVNVTHPQGIFTYNLEDPNSILCFGGGIGITPFITFAKYLAEHASQKKIYVIYFASERSDFILADEFDLLTKNHSNIKITYYDTATKGRITQKNIIDVIQAYDKPEVYICGSKTFEKLIHDALKSIQYKEDKIHVELFLHAGSA